MNENKVIVSQEIEQPENVEILTTVPAQGFGLSVFLSILSMFGYKSSKITKTKNNDHRAICGDYIVESFDEDNLTQF